MNGYTYGFRILGDCRETRRLVDWQLAFDAYMGCDERAEVHRQAYLSAFTFGPDFRQHLESTGSTRDFGGDCWSPFVWFDVDREDDLQAALHDTRRLVSAITDRLKVGDDDLLTFYSGAKGFHVGIPAVLWKPTPSAVFHTIAKTFALGIAQAAKVTIDQRTYAKVQAFRAPNSRHPKTGLHKRHIEAAVMFELSIDGIRQLAKEPAPVEWDPPSGTSDQAAELWTQAERQVIAQAEAVRVRRANGNGSTVNRATLEFIREGAGRGDRHRMLYSAARNLAELGAGFELAYALLSESALDSGLSPSEVRRQIQCGIGDALKGGAS